MALKSLIPGRSLMTIIAIHMRRMAVAMAVAMTVGAVRIGAGRITMDRPGR